MSKLNVLSLFDGISVARLAFKELNIDVNYYASEIDSRAAFVSQTWFPDTTHLGDVRNIDENTDLPPIDLLIFGSPCQDLSSIRPNRDGLDGDKSSLFYEAIRILELVQPKYFIMENVASMSMKDRNVITQTLGVRPILINSNLLTAQNRSRYYWTNIPGVTQPTDQKLNLESILDDGYTDRDKSNAVLTTGSRFTRSGLLRYLSKSIGNVVFHDQSFAELPKRKKLELLDSMSDEEVKALFRPLSVIELERLQGLPSGYVTSLLKKTPATKAIGNSFTLPVIKHLLSFI